MGCGIIMTVVETKSMIQNDGKFPIKRIMRIDSKATFEQHLSTQPDSSTFEVNTKNNESKIISAIVENSTLKNNTTQTISKSAMNKKETPNDTATTYILKKPQKEQQKSNIGKKDVAIKPKMQSKPQADKKTLPEKAKREQKETVAKLTENNKQKQQTLTKQGIKRLSNKNNEQKIIPEQKLAKNVSPPSMKPPLQLANQKQTVKEQKQQTKINPKIQVKDKQDIGKSSLQTKNIPNNENIDKEIIQNNNNKNIEKKQILIQQLPSKSKVSNPIKANKELNNDNSIANLKSTEQAKIHKDKVSQKQNIKVETKLKVGEYAPDLNQFKKKAEIQKFKLEEQKIKNQQKKIMNEKKKNDELKKLQEFKKKVQKEERKKLEKEAKQIKNIYQV